MHGGKIFVRGNFPKENLSDNIKITSLDEDDKKELSSYIKKYCKYFGEDYNSIMSKSFKKLAPADSRPYANLYTPN
jgi:glutamate synthase domain-containing protein 3